ncbi:hypothetical protein COLO4_31990 [Corchorus olitorius]|uniref:Uncharacterized protein n=1 Tax=Corchorus olitorius TaxID=93759 RepID=A0A1R3H2N9_9ROSI|nr:hypothetical protein COLO4_31990 [Corchorus olitorius]
MEPGQICLETLTAPHAISSILLLLPLESCSAASSVFPSDEPSTTPKTLKEIALSLDLSYSHREPIENPTETKLSENPQRLESGETKPSPLKLLSYYDFDIKISEMRTQNESFPTISNLRRPQTLWKVENRDRKTQTGGKGKT